MATPRTASLRRSLPSLGRTLRRLRPYARTQWPLMAAGVLFILLEVAMRLLEPWPLKFILDDVITDTPSEGSSGIPLIDGLGPEALLAVCVVAVALIAGLRALFSYLSTIALALAGNRVLTAVRADLYRHIQRLSLRFHHRARAGDLITRLVGDVGRLQDVAVTAALPLAANVLTVIGMAAVMLAINWQLALVALAIFPFFSPSLLRRGGRIRTVARAQRKREGEMAATASEALGAMRVVQALSLERAMEGRFARSNQASLRDGVKAKRLAAGLERRVDVLVGVGTALVLWFGALQVRSGAITPGDLVVFLMYLKTAFKPMRDVAKYTGRIAQAAASGERIVELLDEEVEVVDAPGALDVLWLRGDVRFEGVGFTYEDGHVPALAGVDLEVPAGTRVGVVGPSGAGKSTVASLLLRLYDPTAGRVTIDGHDLRSMTLQSLRAQVAVVLQDSVLFGLTVRENIRLGRADASDEEIEQAARLANAHGFVLALRDGYDAVLGERGATLSGGQRQRLAIARAALRDAPIVVLDEPTTGLDEANERVVGEALRRLGDGRTTFHITHALQTVADADLLVFVDAGRVVEQGTHDELMALGGRYAETYRLQAGMRETMAALAEELR